MSEKIQSMIVAFVEEAKKDDWKVKLLNSGERELKHSEGYKILIFELPQIDGPAITVWGPDKLNIYYPSFTYNFELIKKNMKFCRRCKRYVDKVVKIYERGRACQECYDKEKVNKWLNPRRGKS